MVVLFIKSFNKLLNICFHWCKYSFTKIIEKLDLQVENSYLDDIKYLVIVGDKLFVYLKILFMICLKRYKKILIINIKTYKKYVNYLEEFRSCTYYG